MIIGNNGFKVGVVTKHRYTCYFWTRRVEYKLLLYISMVTTVMSIGNWYKFTFNWSDFNTSQLHKHQSYLQAKKTPLYCLFNVLILSMQIYHAVNYLNSVKLWCIESFMRHSIWWSMVTCLCHEKHTLLMYISVHTRIDCYISPIQLHL